jgi:hypothetical protein
VHPFPRLKGLQVGVGHHAVNSAYLPSGTWPGTHSASRRIAGLMARHRVPTRITSEALAGRACGLTGRLPETSGSSQ